MLRLEKSFREQPFEVFDEQVQLLECFSMEFRKRHIEAKHTGDLVAVDTFFVGSLKGVSKIYLQSVIDCYSRYAWGRLYTNKLPLTAVHVLNEVMLPFFEEHNAWINTILSDKGREFCGRPANHP
jgi:transposase InsO family protein